MSIKIVAAHYISEENRSTIPVVDEFFNYYLKLKKQLSGFFTLPQPKTGTFEEFADNLSGFAISINNPKVIASAISGTPELAKVKFTTNETTDQEFTFAYTYTNEEGETSGFSQKVKLTAIEDIKTGWYNIICGGDYKTWIATSHDDTYFSDFTLFVSYSGGVSEFKWSFNETARTLEWYYYDNLGNRVTSSLDTVLIINNTYMKTKSLDEYGNIKEWIAQ